MANLHSIFQILTASHVIEDFYPIDRVTIVLGTLTLSSGGDIYRPQVYIRHELYDREGYIWSHWDIGLVKTTTSIRFTQNVQPIPLATVLPPDGGFPLVATGWGYTKPVPPGEAPPPDRLQILNMTHLATEKCREVWGEVPFFSVSQMCSISAVGRGACFGDSGWLNLTAAVCLFESKKN